ncbi:Acyl-CoA Delta(11) desaturase [Amphibalanus amphitrite]|uniref:Acyl-CoA Delta(11) desaturase n=1 Tax=Amphibalanus amphitrite TaxID=1232801 RepID=A0A6A4X5U6_AMPAM|nr:acyl-CoA Delta-9 desaturase-like [Amphibalanus amphitrite]KAF0314647.1 Acyl-CoA Delta(11) desaturase [Amphibalanus amphitrite]
MPPNIHAAAEVVDEHTHVPEPVHEPVVISDINANKVLATSVSPVTEAEKPAATSTPVPRILVPRSMLLLTVLHVMAALGWWHVFTDCDRRTFYHAWLWGIASGLGVTAGAHRLWAHRAYSASLPLRVVLMIMFTISGQNDIYEWVRDHRLHHRHSETDADPHNATRGFFFAHCGWLMVRKHPEVRRQGAKVDLSDLLADPVVAFQRSWFVPMVLSWSFIIPSLIPHLAWGESLSIALLISTARLVTSLHCTWLVNSAAHIWGMHPYDDHIHPAENLGVAIAALGEGWHNYHHVFPWDYRAAELPGYGANLTTGFIDLCAHFGWVWGRKTVPRDIIKRRAKRTGDGSWEPHPELTDSGNM